MQKIADFKVGGIIYEVRAVQDLAIKYEVYGSCEYSSATIDVDAGLAPDRMAQVVVHELLHAILNEAGYDDHDEELVVRAGKVLAQFLADNYVHVSQVEEEDEKIQKSGIGFDTSQEEKENESSETE